MKTILTPVDFSTATRGVLAAAVELARLTGGRVVLLHAIQYVIATTDYGLTADMLQQTMRLNETAARNQIVHLEKSIAARGVPVSSRLTTGQAAAGILEAAGKLRANYIVLGSHGHTAFYDLLVGGTTHAVLKKAACPVVVIPPVRKKTASKR